VLLPGQAKNRALGQFRPDSSMIHLNNLRRWTAYYRLDNSPGTPLKIALDCSK
jgi:hypothetical protein